MLRSLVKTIFKHDRDRSSSTRQLLDTLKRDIRRDVVGAFDLAEPLIARHDALYADSSTFLDFLFKLCGMDDVSREAKPTAAVVGTRSKDDEELELSVRLDALTAQLAKTQLELNKLVEENLRLSDDNVQLQYEIDGGGRRSTTLRSRSGSVPPADAQRIKRLESDLRSALSDKKNLCDEVLRLNEEKIRSKSDDSSPIDANLEKARDSERRLTQSIEDRNRLDTELDRWKNYTLFIEKQFEEYLFRVLEIYDSTLLGRFRDSMTAMAKNLFKRVRETRVGLPPPEEYEAFHQFQQEEYRKHLRPQLDWIRRQRLAILPSDRPPIVERPVLVASIPDDDDDEIKVDPPPNAIVPLEITREHLALPAPTHRRVESETARNDPIALPAGPFSTTTDPTHRDENGPSDSMHVDDANPPLLGLSLQRHLVENASLRADLMAELEKARLELQDFASQSERERNRHSAESTSMREDLSRCREEIARLQSKLNESEKRLENERELGRSVMEKMKLFVEEMMRTYDTIRMQQYREYMEKMFRNLSTFFDEKQREMNFETQTTYAAELDGILSDMKPICELPWVLQTEANAASDVLALEPAKVPSDLLAELAETETRVSDAERKILDLKSKLGEREAELAETETRVSEAERQIRDLKAQLEAEQSARMSESVERGYLETLRQKISNLEEDSKDSDRRLRDVLDFDKCAIDKIKWFVRELLETFDRMRLKGYKEYANGFLEKFVRYYFGHHESRLERKRFSKDFDALFRDWLPFENSKFAALSAPNEQKQDETFMKNVSDDDFLKLDIRTIVDIRQGKNEPLRIVDEVKNYFEKAASSVKTRSEEHETGEAVTPVLDKIHKDMLYCVQLDLKAVEKLHEQTAKLEELESTNERHKFYFLEFINKMAEKLQIENVDRIPNLANEIENRMTALLTERPGIRALGHALPSIDYPIDDSEGVVEENLIGVTVVNPLQDEYDRLKRESDTKTKLLQTNLLKVARLEKQLEDENRRKKGFKKRVEREKKTVEKGKKPSDRIVQLVVESEKSRREETVEKGKKPSDRIVEKAVESEKSRREETVEKGKKPSDRLVEKALASRKTVYRGMKTSQSLLEKAKATGIKMSLKKTIRQLTKSAVDEGIRKAQLSDELTLARKELERLRSNECTAVVPYEGADLSSVNRLSERADTDKEYAMKLLADAIRLHFYWVYRQNVGTFQEVRNRHWKEKDKIIERLRTNADRLNLILLEYVQLDFWTAENDLEMKEEEEEENTMHFLRSLFVEARERIDKHVDLRRTADREQPREVTARSIGESLRRQNVTKRKMNDDVSQEGRKKQELHSEDSAASGSRNDATVNL